MSSTLMDQQLKLLHQSHLHHLRSLENERNLLKTNTQFFNYPRAHPINKYALHLNLAPNHSLQPDPFIERCLYYPHQNQTLTYKTDLFIPSKPNVTSSEIQIAQIAYSKILNRWQGQVSDLENYSIWDKKNKLENVNFHQQLTGAGKNSILELLEMKERQHQKEYISLKQKYQFQNYLKPRQQIENATKMEQIRNRENKVQKNNMNITNCLKNIDQLPEQSTINTTSKKVKFIDEIDQKDRWKTITKQSGYHSAFQQNSDEKENKHTKPKVASKIKNIENRLKNSFATYVDSKHRTLKHEQQHLTNTFRHENEQRKQIIQKLSNSK